MTPGKVTTLLLIRHGETAWNAEHRIQGRLDVPLSTTGLWQAGRLAQRAAYLEWAPGWMARVGEVLGQTLVVR